MTADTDLRASEGRVRTLVLGGLVFLSTCVLFAGALENGFVPWDDPQYVVENRAVTRGLDAESVAWAFQATRLDNWHPLTWLSHMLDCQLGDLDPRVHHGTSVLIHALVALLVFVALASGTGAHWTAFVVALLFAWHPLRVESVAWISERKDVLAGFFWMLAVWLHLRPGSRGIGRGLAVALAMALGLLCKPVLVTLPLVLLLLDRWPLERSEPPWRLVLEKLHLFALALGSVLVTLFVQSGGGAVSGFEAVPLSARLGNAVLSVIAYARESLWPPDLAFFYPHPVIVDAQRLSASSPGVWGGALLILAVTGLAFRLRRSRPWWLVGWLWFLIVLLPMIGLVQVGMQAKADRYTYLPSLGLALLVAFEARAWCVHRALLGRVVPVGVALYLLLLAWRTPPQVATWKDGRSLFAHAVGATEDNYLAHNLLGAQLLEEGELGAAARHFEEGLRLRPGSVTGLMGLGFVLMNLGQYAQAEKRFRTVVKLRPSKPDALANLGRSLEYQGKLNEAEERYLELLARRPRSVDARLGQARLHLLRQEPEAALEILEALARKEADNEELTRLLAEARRRSNG